MNIEFLSGFQRDYKKIAEIILNCIPLFEKANSLDEIHNIKKLHGHTTAYRYRKGKYRIGFYLEDETVVFAAFAPRDRIYKKFH